MDTLKRGEDAQMYSTFFSLYIVKHLTQKQQQQKNIKMHLRFVAVISKRILQ